MRKTLEMVKASTLIMLKFLNRHDVCCIERNVVRLLNFACMHMRLADEWRAHLNHLIFLSVVCLLSRLNVVGGVVLLLHFDDDSTVLLF